MYARTVIKNQIKNKTAFFLLGTFLLYATPITISIHHDTIEILENKIRDNQKILTRYPYTVDILKQTAHLCILLNKVEEAIPLFKRLAHLKKGAEMMVCVSYLSLERYDDVLNLWAQNPFTRSVKDKKVLITAGWGLGDHFMFIRYAALLKEAGAHVIVQAKKPLLPLFSRCPFIDTLISMDDPRPEADIITNYESLMKLTYAFTGTIIPQNIPYLTADPERVSYWKDQLASDSNFKVGLCWNSSIGECNREKSIYTKRTIPLRAFMPLSRVKNVSFYSLQQVTGLEQLNTISRKLVIHTFDETFDKQYGAFMDTAAVMENLDLIISVDTSIPHLAGALGRPVWVLIPYSADWRWPLTRVNSTPWYSTMHLFKQQTPGCWADVIERVVQELEQTIKQHTQR